MDGMEVFSNEKSISQIVNSGDFITKQKIKIESLIDTPYFARIDFRYDGEDQVENIYIYICRNSFMDKSGDMLIYDWRAPISSMYYDFELGNATYDAPLGEVKGDITLKRQFKIVKSYLEYVLESNLSIGDEVLQRELSNTSDQRMKNIVATIQKEQNKIIRNEKIDTLIIQGVAGSGKTSFALHRVAYFLYKYREYLSAENIVIISPNKVFADYISNVLPELGEEPIIQLDIEDIAKVELGKKLHFEKFSEQISDLLEEYDKDKIKRINFKSSLEFISLLDKYIKYVEANYFNADNFIYNNITKVSAVQRMQDYIEENLNRKITLYELAQHSNYSPWYSAKLFKEYIGKSPFEYIRLKRLSASALELRDNDKRVVDVALEFVFDSHEGFTRAFKKEFGITPKKYKRDTPPIYLYNSYPIKEQYIKE